MSEISDFARSWLDRPESPLVEKKAEGDHKDWPKTLVAFANSTPANERAILFIGASNEKPHKGISSEMAVDEIQRKIADIAAGRCYPPIKIEITHLVIKQDEKDSHIVAVIVPASTTLPHFSGPAYVRDGSKSRSASKEVYADLIASHHETARRLIAWKKQQIQWRLIASNGLYYLGNATVMDCVGTSAILQDDNTGYSWPTPIANITFLDRGTLRPILEVKYWSSDRELIQYMLERWLVFITTNEPLYHQQVAYIKKQAELHPELFQPVMRRMLEAGNSSKYLKKLYDDLNDLLGIKL